MSRLDKKCVFASTGGHVLLALILVTCPAFLTPKAKPSDVTPITFIPSMLIDGPFAGGGNPNAGRAPTPAPPPPQPVVQPQPAPQPKPAPEKVIEVTPPKDDGESLEVSKESTRKKPQISLTPVVRNPNTKSTSRETSTVDTKEQQQREWKQQLAKQFGSAASNIKSGAGSATKVDGDYGPGGGGPSYASYAAWVLTVYDNAWVAPEDAASEDATVEVSVTIASDGTVTAKRIIKRSGDAAVDSSVQRTLDRVTTMGRPFPEGTKDKQRSYIIPFNMKTKRGAA